MPFDISSWVDVIISSLASAFLYYNLDKNQKYLSKLNNICTAEKINNGKLVKVEGLVSNIRNPIYCTYEPAKSLGLKTAVYELVIDRHSTVWSPFFLLWMDKVDTISRIIRVSPFNISSGNSSFTIIPPSSFSNFQFPDLQNVSSDFSAFPSNSALQTAVDFVIGEKILGIKSHENILPTSGNVTAIGVLNIKGGNLPFIQEMEIVAHPDEPFILSNLSFADILNIEKHYVKYWKFLFRGSCAVLFFFLLKHAYRVYRKFLIKNELKRLRKRSSSGDDMSSSCCVCLENKRNCVFMDCGHFVSCWFCVVTESHFFESKVRQNHLKVKSCPLCRQTIRHAIKVFAS
jgi:E3 ubiquitin-protein ligase MUL1